MSGGRGGWWGSSNEKWALLVRGGDPRGVRKAPRPPMSSIRMSFMSCTSHSNATSLLFDKSIHLLGVKNFLNRPLLGIGGYLTANPPDQKARTFTSTYCAGATR